MTLTKDNVKIGLKVAVTAWDHRAGGLIRVETEVITNPREQGGTWVVNVAKVGDPIPVDKLEKL